uniref:HNH domain-containing protein n=1 Tax=viral metagenome TaxID=1070528 RepID=A0A6C0D8I9_9ZZZZ
MSENENNKSIDISGTNNRYLINKLKKEQPIVKLRKTIKKTSLPPDSYSIEAQELIINNIYQHLNKEQKCEYKDVLNQIEKKLQSYKQQDLLKKRYDEENFINIRETINKLYESKLLCYYCNDKMFILYDIVREMKQWTLDRIDNDIGHNSNNVVISCLDCNLKRRRTNKDAFLFTKQLNIVKSELESK